MKTKKLKLIIFLLLAVVLILILYFYLLFFVPLSPDNNISKTFIIEKEDSVLKIANNLKEENLIRSPLSFIAYVRLKKEQANLKAGGYELSSSMTIQEITDYLVKGKTSSFKVTIIEGWNIKDIEIYFKKLGINDFYETIDNYQTYLKEDNIVFKEKPSNTGLEGFLFPDSYYFEKGVATNKIIETIIKNFEQKTKAMIESSNKPLYEVLIIASLLEKEAREIEDKKIISGILWKRIENNIPLELCSTIIYLTGRPNILFEDLKIDSPYNTYIYSGLPPEPIANPGLESIKASINPIETNYWFYLSTSEGEIIFSETIQEHNINKAKYLR
jgi:UPF0755 protein